MKKLNNYLAPLAMLCILAIAGCGEDEPTVDAPDARFTSSVEGLVVTFTDASIGADTYSWDFGDGNSSADASPVHTYSTGGSFEVTLTVTNAGGESSASETLTIEEPFTAASIVGSWSITAEEGALAVGPAAGSSEWWSLPAGDLEARACQLDDEFIFGEDGSFTIDLQDETFLEDWQGGAFSCGAPVAPHDGSGSYTFGVEEMNITINGEGAYIALAKVGNAGELPNVDVPSSITFEVAEFNETSMTLSIEAGSAVFWTFKLTKN